MNETLAVALGLVAVVLLADYIMHKLIDFFNKIR
jgi:hypothetical protein